MEEAVPRSNEWRGADQHSGLLQEMTAARRHWVGDGGTSSGDTPFRALACFAVRPRCDTPFRALACFAVRPRCDTPFRALACFAVRPRCDTPFRALACF